MRMQALSCIKEPTKYNIHDRNRSIYMPPEAGMLARSMSKQSASCLNWPSSLCAWRSLGGIVKSTKHKKAGS